MEESEHKFGALRCNFCGLFHTQVKVMLTGPSVMICDQCVSLCVDYIRENHPDFKRDINDIPASL
jgi:ATP-dependent Clp protease ATP-binding subunit ClpX